MPPRRERRQPKNALLRAGINELENIGNDYVDFMLMDSTVHVDMENIAAGFSIPKTAREGFKEIGAPEPQLIQGINLDVAYDRGAGHFKIKRGAVAFDNRFGVAFHYEQTTTDEEAPRHPVDLFTHNAEGRLQMRRIGFMHERQVHEFFVECGVNLPMPPQQATWEAVVPTLAAAERQVTTTQKTTLSSGLKEVIVSDQTIATSELSSTETRSSEKHDASWSREASFQVVDYSGAAIRGVEAVLRSNSPFDRLQFAGFYRRNGPRTVLKPHKLYDEESLPPVTHEGELAMPTIGDIYHLVETVKSIGP